MGNKHIIEEEKINKFFKLIMDYTKSKDDANLEDVLRVSALLEYDYLKVAVYAELMQLTEAFCSASNVSLRSFINALLSNFFYSLNKAGFELLKDKDFPEEHVNDFKKGLKKKYGEEYNGEWS